MGMREDDLRAMIVAAFPDAQVTITDLAGDNDHYAAHVVSASFQGMTRIAQHKAVYAALGGRRGGERHAFHLTTAIPSSGAVFCPARWRPGQVTHHDHPPPKPPTPHTAAHQP